MNEGLNSVCQSCTHTGKHILALKMSWGNCDSRGKTICTPWSPSTTNLMTNLIRDFTVFFFLSSTSLSFQSQMANCVTSFQNIPNSYSKVARSIQLQNYSSISPSYNLLVLSQTPHLIMQRLLFAHAWRWLWQFLDCSHVLCASVNNNVLLSNYKQHIVLT